MKMVLRSISMLALVFTVLPAFLFLGGRMDIEKVKILMILATVVWFVVTPLWMGRGEVEKG